MLPVWTIRCTYGAGALEKRDAALAAHEAYLVAHSSEIRFAGPMFADDDATRTGLWLMIEAADRAGAEAFIAGEGFSRAGMFGAIEIKRFAAVGPGTQRQAEIAPDPALQMFVCERVAGPDTADSRETVSEALESWLTPLVERAVVAGNTVADDGSRTIGALAIVEVADQAAAEGLAAVGPLLRPRANVDVRIDRWRFGKSVV